MSRVAPGVGYLSSSHPTPTVFIPRERSLEHQVLLGPTRKGMARAEVFRRLLADIKDTAQGFIVYG